MEYDLNVDRLVKTWERHHYSIEANSLQEAKDKLLRMMEDDPYDENMGFVNSEILFDANHYPTPEENGGIYTVEIINGGFTGETLWTNAKL